MSLNPRLTFSEEIKVNTEDLSTNLNLYKWNGSTWIQLDGWALGFYTTPSAELSITSQVIAINPFADFDPNTQYAITLGSAAIKDMAGNMFAGISDFTTLNFITIDPASQYTSSAAFDTTTGTGIEGASKVDDGTNDNTVFIVDPSHLIGSVLNGGLGLDTVRLAGGNGNSFDFTGSSLVTAVEALVVDNAHTDPVTVIFNSSKGLNTFTRLSGTNNDTLVLMGGAAAEVFDLSGISLTGFNTLRASGTAAAGYTLKLHGDQVSASGSWGSITRISGSEGTNDTLTLVDSGDIDLSANGLMLSDIESVDFNDDQLSRTVTIDQALNITFGTSGSNTVATAAVTLDLSNKTLSGVDALVSINNAGTTFHLASDHVGTNRVVTVTGSNGHNDKLRIDGDSVDLTSLTLNGIENFENLISGGSVTVDQSALSFSKSFTGNGGVLSFVEDVTNIDLTDKTLTGISTLLTQATSGSVNLSMASNQFQGSGGPIQYIGAVNASADVTLYVSGPSFDASGVVLSNIDLITTNSATGVSFTGSGSNDYIRGGSGNDTIFGNTGSDTLEGGVGNDVFVISGQDFSLIGTTRILDASTGDTIRINGSHFTGGSITLGSGAGLEQNQIHLENTGNGFTRLHVGIDNNAGSDLTIDLVGTYSAANFNSNGTDIAISLQTTPVPPPLVPQPNLPQTIVPISSNLVEDGVTVGRGTGIDSLTGRQFEQFVVAPITNERQDAGGSPSSNADIHLGGSPLSPSLMASLPIGVGLQAYGPTGLNFGELVGAMAQEIGRINAGGGALTETFNLAGLSTVLPSSSPVILRTVTPTLAEGVNFLPGQPIIISVPSNTDTNQTISAVVIDGRSLPGGTAIELHDVNYAVVTGNIFVTGGSGHNVVVGDDAPQFIRLGPGDDILRGGGGDDTVGSDEGRDLIYGDGGDDVIFGGDGYDRLHGGIGNDVVDGGTGNDVMRFDASYSNVIISWLADGSMRISDVNGDQGTDIVRNVEVLRLNDRVVLLEQVKTIYTGTTKSQFNEHQYLGIHADVAAAVQVGAFASGLDHYVKQGAAEGRVATFSFDNAFYLAQNPDVASAVNQGVFSSAFAHFVSHGETEKRQPDATHTYDGRLFSESYYLEVNRDVALAINNGHYKSGYDHWVKVGEAEGRSTFASLKFELSLFDENFYVKQNPDVAAAVATGQYASGLDHFLRSGENYVRDPNALFDTDWYLKSNTDVANAIANGNLHSAFEHYALFGWKEGRNPSAFFDTWQYLADHADVAAANMNPLAHLLEYGLNEGRAITSSDTGMWL